MEIQFDLMVTLLLIVGGISILVTAAIQVLKTSNISVPNKLLPVVAIVFGVFGGYLATLLTSGFSTSILLLAGAISGFMSVGNFEFITSLQKIFSKEVTDRLSNDK